MKKLISVFFLFISISYAEANSDSLWSVWQDNEAHDTARLEALNKYIWAEYLFYDPDSAFLLAQEHYDFADKRGLSKYKGQALSTQGVSFAVFGKNDEALTYYEKSLAFFEEVNYAKGIASITNNIGVIYLERGESDKAIENYLKCMEMMQVLGELENVARAQSNIGLVYSDKGDYSNAISYLSQSLSTSEKLKDKNGIVNALINIGILFSNINEHETAIQYFRNANKILDDSVERELESRSSILNNLGISYSYLGDNDKALDYYMASLGVKEKLGDPNDFALTLNNIGTIYMDEGDYEKAESYFFRSLNSFQLNEEVIDIISPLTNIAQLHLYRKQYYKSIEVAKQCLDIATKNEDLSHIGSNSYTLYQCYKALGNSKKALSMYELYSQSNDSLQSEENNKEIIRQSFKYEYGKKLEADSLIALEEKLKTDAQIEAQQAQLDKERIQRFALYGGVGILIFFGGFMYNRFKITEKQKGIIEEQKDEVDSQSKLIKTKNKEILDSIAYAKRIQSAILPPSWMIRKYLVKSFVLYKPKDVVAGDFYWLRKVEDTIYFAAADCTGHGVPGAMVSVVCNNALNRSIREYGLVEPGEILDKTREIVLKEFEKADDEVKDGMDIALCSLNGSKLSYAGANNPLWIVRNNKLNVIKGNKQPIGKYINPSPFTSHHFEVQKGDCIYIFTDGFVDQFGGPKGKKYKVKALQELILSIQGRKMKDQKLLLNNTFTQWKGDLEQVDDICIIGCRI